MNEKLRRYWFPVALSADVADKPIPVTLLGEGVVLYRTTIGIAALHDLCIHRGTPLSLGWIDGDELVCAYHGWGYEGSGACTRIPSLAPGRPIPPKARVGAYQVQELYGLVWVCLGTPTEPIPEYPEYADPTYHVFWTRHRLHANAARVIENVMDFAHFPWVHPGILGDRSKPVYESTPAKREGNEIHYVVDDEATNAIRTYRVTLPYALHMHVRRRSGPDLDRINALFFVSQPLGDRDTIFWFGHGRNFDLDKDDTVLIGQDNHVIQQDQRMVEAQRPEELPLDLSAELHLKGTDAAAVEYRRSLASLGLGA
ncbi:MAG TPA: aromatic ring-hydroxylating dioxygenase subunit alpha [Candidatus Limnocylindria bacterium]|nr:aromatic ring-hydroxylating dioxygenase subunit alpha [Candidatus Limnocylindria bacterium]